GRAVGLEAVDEPEPILGEREGQVALARDLQQRRLSISVVDHRGDVLSELGGRRGGEKLAERDLDAQLAAKGRYHLDGQEGVATEAEEVVPCSDALDPQDLAPDQGQGALERRRRKDVLFGV